MAVLLISPVSNLIAGYKFQPALIVRILIVTIIFFHPKMQLRDDLARCHLACAVKLGRIGQVVGKIYALYTFGSIIGTFAAGFFSSTGWARAGS